MSLRRTWMVAVVAVGVALPALASTPTARAAPQPARWEGVAVSAGDRDCFADPTGDTRTVDGAGFESAGGADPAADVDQVCLDLTGTWPRVEVRTVASPADTGPYEPAPWDDSVLDLRLRTGAGDHLIRTRLSSLGASMVNRPPEGGWRSCFSSEDPVVDGRTLTVTPQGDCLPDQDVVEGGIAVSWRAAEDPEGDGLAGVADAAPDTDRPLRDIRRYGTCLQTRAIARDLGIGRPTHWLGRFNLYRTQAGVPPVARSADYEADARAHSEYLTARRGEPLNAHNEEFGHPAYSVEGRAAGANGNVAQGGALGPTSIDRWMDAPFHALHMVRPETFVTGFGDAAGAATLDVGRGTAPAAPCAPDVVHWPADGASTVLTMYGGGENPDPLEACPGFSAPTGLPIIVRGPSDRPAPTASSLRDVTAGHDLEHCRVTPGNHPRMVDGSFFLIARQPLERGHDYRASYVVEGATTSWQFEVGPKRRRLAGADRFATAALAARTWTPSARTVFLATGRDFPDALAAAPAAATDGAPVALVERDRVPAATVELLRDLRPERVVLIGGTVAIAPSVADAVAELTGRAPERLAGGDRYGTAVEVSQATYDAGVDTVLVATGTGFADALAGGAVAAAHGWPLLLAPPGGLPTAVSDELGRLDPRRIVVLGGETAVPASLLDALGPHADRVDRVAGGDRYATAAEIADRLGPFPPDEAVVATGRNFADALAAAAAAGGRGAPVLLTDGSSPSLPTLRMAPLLSPPVITVMGGTAAVSAEAEDAFTGR